MIQTEVPNLQQLETLLSYPNGETYYFIMNDGTLWKGKGVFKNLATTQEEKGSTVIFAIEKAKQVGNRNDWVSLYMYRGMTADGKIWNRDQPQIPMNLQSRFHNHRNNHILFRNLSASQRLEPHRGGREKKKSSPNLPIQFPKLNRLHDVIGLDIFFVGKVGNGSGDFQNPVISASTQSHMRHGLFH